MSSALNGGIRIHYEVRGEGLPIVLHPGAVGDLSAWEKAGYLAALRDYKCILIDPRGQGQSDAPENVEAHTIQNYASDVIAVLDKVGVYRTSFFGWSNGGRVGFYLCADQPGRVGALITLGSCVDLDPKFSRGFVDSLRERGIAGYLESAEAEEKTRFPGWLRENFLNSDPEMFALQVEGLSKWKSAAAAAPSIRSPTLLITGGEEYPDSDCQKIANQIPAGAQLVVLRNLGHVGAFLRSDLVVPYVRDFLSRVQFGMDRRFS